MLAHHPALLIFTQGCQQGAERQTCNLSTGADRWRCTLVLPRWYCCRKKGKRAADSDSDYSLSEGGDEGGSPAPAAPPPAAAAADSDGPLSGEDSEDERARADQELSDDDDLREADGQVDRSLLPPQHAHIEELDVE